MSGNSVEQGKRWVLDVFEQAREQYRETVPVDTIFPWQGGPTDADSRGSQESPALSTHRLAFEVGQEPHAISFTEPELTAGADPDNSEARFAIKKKILETFTALESQEHARGV
jgi:hypothetical protein